jgi:type II secretory pathway component PulJ
MFRTSQRGFTMGEVLLVTSLLTFASTGVMTLVKKKSSNSNGEQYFKQMVMDGRTTVDQIAAELSLAGLPRNIADPALTFANSNQVAASVFLVATGEQIVFEADLDRNGAVERVEYRLHGDALERSAVTKNADGSVPPAGYDVIAEHVDNDGLPVFTFDGDLTGDKPISPDPQQVRVMLLLRSPVRDRKAGRTRTVGFESIAQRNTAPTAPPVQVEASAPEPIVDTTKDVAAAPSDLPAGEPTAETRTPLAIDSSDPNSPDFRRSPSYPLLDLPLIYPAEGAHPVSFDDAAPAENSEQIRVGLPIPTTRMYESL